MHPCGLHLVIGKKGAGKSMLACKMMTRILGETNRQVITNLPLNIPEIRDYMSEHWPAATSIDDRITIITDTKLLKRFWLTMGNNWWIPDVTKERWNLGERLDYATAYRWKETTKSVRKRKHITDLDKDELTQLLNEFDPPIEYTAIDQLRPAQFIIDELQNIFPSRAFMQTSHGALFWLSQQRKLGADFIGITQNADLIDKEFRDLADDFLFITNWGRKQKSWFRLPKVMTWAKYDTKPVPGVKPMLSGAFRLDVNGIGKLYDTSAGVGIEGGLLADTKEKVGGIHWAWFIGIVLCLIYLATFVPGCTHSGIMKMLSLKPKNNPLAQATLTNSLSLSASTNTTPAPGPATMPRISTNHLTGITFLNNRYRFWFPDGTSKPNTDRQFQNYLVENGEIVGCRFGGTNWTLP